MTRHDDPDLPGDADFKPIKSGEEIIDGKVAAKDALSAAEQAAIHHNKLRYAELQKLRAGLPNRYEETRYR